ncbi:hypothetical protein BDV34DRAFT_3124 [Aspergillus parasiticus]|uniref:Uncharacterized protein n=1 Tax=Aspergillus parasiticus TaxID=5067 RepID=A0A5N6E4R8_ASPPA|nr:hypothetical protein BDV34DRAFT_3124 [Aspergillus parasiticus]
MDRKIYAGMYVSTSNTGRGKWIWVLDGRNMSIEYMAFFFYSSLWLLSYVYYLLFFPFHDLLLCIHLRIGP